MRRSIMTLGLMVACLTTFRAAACPLEGHGNKNACKEAEVTLEQVKKLVGDKKVVFIDANSKETYAEGHIPGSISYAAHQGKLAQVLPADKSTTLVAYCGGPRCSAWEAAAKEAMGLGYKNLKHFNGGIKEWKSAGLAVEK